MFSIVFAVLFAVDDAEVRALEARRSLRSGEIKVQSVDFGREGDEWVPGRTIRYDIFFSGDNLRTLQSAGTAGPDGTLSVFAKEDALRLNGKVYRRVHDLHDPLTPMAIPAASVDDAAIWRSYQKYITDPRLLGLQPVPFGILHSCEYQEFVASPIRSSTEAEDSSLDDVPVRLVTYRNEGVTARMWIAPSRNWNLLKSEIDAPGRDRVTLVCELAQFDGIWFPKKITFEEFDTKGNPVERNVSTIVKAKFNLDVSERLTIADMEPVKGSMIIDAGKPGTVLGQWDGEEVVPLSFPKTSADMTAEPARRSWVFSMFAANAAAGVVLLGWLYLRSRRA